MARGITFVDARIAQALLRSSPPRNAPQITDPLAPVVAEINAMHARALMDHDEEHRVFALMLLADVARHRKQFGMRNVRIELAHTEGAA